MIAIVCGDRHWKKSKAVHREVYKRREKLTCLFEGGATGADTHGKEAGDLLGIQVVTAHANWTFHKRAAGPIRNANQLKLALALAQYTKEKVIVLAFHKDLRQSKGTKDMVRKARKAGCIVKVFKK